MSLEAIGRRIRVAPHILASIAENHRQIYAREHNGQRADELSDVEIIEIWDNNRIEDDPDAVSMEDMRNAILAKA